MENRKLVIVFVLIVLFLIAIVPYAQATGNELLIIVNNEENQLNIIENNEQNSILNNEVDNEVNNVEQNTTINEPNNTANTQANNEEGMPQTGVAEDTTLFIFIGICIASAVYAYTKIRNYKNI
ncbi:MAG: hypothetical protein ACI4UU_03100 [Clostridia bacterium]